jgi:hypothetical protein
VRLTAPYRLYDDYRLYDENEKQRKLVLYYYAQQQHRGEESNGNDHGKDVSLATRQQRPNGIPEGYDDFMSDLQLTVEITSSQTAVVFKVGGFHQVSDEFVQSIPHV